MEEKKVKKLAPAYIEDRFLVIEDEVKTAHIAFESQLHKMREQLYDINKNHKLITNELMIILRRVAELERDRPGFIQRIKNLFR